MLVYFFCNQQQLKQRTYMQLQNKIFLPLLKPISLDLLQQIEYSQTLLETHAKIEEKEEGKYDIALVDDLIIVYQEQTNGMEALGYVRLDFSLKFQRIFFVKNLNERVLKGFKLTNDYAETISFQIEFQNLAILWVTHLSKAINESGFHNYYKPIRTLGKGSFATVYEILRLDDGKRFAAKVFAKDNIKNNPSKMSSFINELEILRYVEHSQLLKLEGVFQSQHSFYVIMETLTGGNLFEYLIKRRVGLALEEIKVIVRNILKGLAELETHGIVHRDIKLENLMMREKGTIEPVIVDFGLAIFEDDEDYVYYQCGTPGYLSPEGLGLKKGEKLTPKSDIFSAGVVLHVLLAGRYLFEGKTPKEVFQSNKLMNFDLSKPEYEQFDREIMELMTKMLSKDPKERFSASDCLNHASLQIQPDLEQKFQISPATTNSDYQF